MKKIFFCAALALTAVGISSCDKLPSLFGSKDKDSTEQTKDGDKEEAEEAKEDVEEEQAAPKAETLDVTMSGAVGKYPIVMSMHVDEEGTLTGAYYYKKSGPGNCLYIIGKKKGDHVIINEFDANGTNTGSFDGYYHNGELKGTMEAKSGHYEFTTSVDDTATPAPFDRVDFGRFFMPSETYTNAGNTYDGGAAGSGNIDELLDRYESFVNDCVRLSKRVQQGDLTALEEYGSVFDKAYALQEELENVEGNMTPAQAARLSKLAAKAANAAR